MQIRKRFSRLERVEYIFSEQDIRRVLMEDAGVTYTANSRVEMDVDTGDEDDGYKLTITITQMFSHPETEEADESTAE